MGDTSPPEGPIEVTLPPPSDDGELSRLPDHADMAEVLAQFQAEEEAARQQVDRPAAVEEREESADLYADITAPQSEQLLSSEFASVLEALDDEPARFLSDARLIRPLGKGGALIVDEGRKKLIEGTAPVLAPDGEGKIDLSLEGAGEGHQPANPIVDLYIPNSAGESVVVGEAGLEISQAGAEREAEGHVIDGSTVFYPDVLTDTDLLVVPTATGVEFFDQLRSDASPEILRFHLALPQGAQLRSSANAAEVIAADGSKLAVVPPPTAVDAQGTAVPVQMQAEVDSLVLNVSRDPGEFAYPILVDPIIQEWYYQNWYQGFNLHALSNGAWRWNTSEGAGSSYVYGSTSCIYSCWGSGRGLYMDTPNGNLPANRWGQWSYSAPNAETYIGNAWVSPLWRDEHVNCPASKYGQPYDYVGMWNESSYNRILYNESTKNNNEGWADLESWGRALIIGMGTSSGISIPCWRDVMAGGTRIWLEDWSRPNLTTSSSGQWMDANAIRLNVSANDVGLGVQKFKATATNTSGTTSEWWTNNSCTGLYEAPCPHNWNLGDGSQPQLNFAPSALPEGINKLSVTAYDAAEKPSFFTNEMTVRVDHSAPVITFSGSLTEQTTLGFERPFYKVKAIALDGDPKANGETEPGKIRSGVVKFEIKLDGVTMTSFTPECAGEANCGAQAEPKICANQMSQGCTSVLSPGLHTVKAIATDAVGRVETKELQFTVARDLIQPTLSANPLPGDYSYVDAFGSLGATNGLLNHPSDVAVDREGNLWIANKENNRIDKWNAKGEFMKPLGVIGTIGGSFKGPSAVAIDPSGNLWVADSTNNRIQKFNEKGEFVLTFGRNVNKTKVAAGGTEAEKNVCIKSSGDVCQAGDWGTANGQLWSPRGIAATDGGNIWVADTANGRIQKFDQTGKLLNVVTGEGTAVGRMKEPNSVAVGPDGSIWVAETGSHRIQRWGPDLGLKLVFGSRGTGDGQFERPAAIDVDGEGNVWVGDQKNNRVQAFNEDGSFLGKFGGAGSGESQFNLGWPFGLAVDAKGNIWVADSDNNRVQRWTRSGPPSYSTSFGTLGTGTGQFNRPVDVAVDPGGNIWALDKGNARIQKFSESGAYLTSVGSTGPGAGKLNAPSGLAIDPSGSLWVADTANHRIEKFNANGEFVLAFGREVNKTKTEAAGTETEKNLCTAASGNVCQAGVAGSTGAQLKAPQGIASTSGGNIWVADTGNNRLKKFNSTGGLLNTISSEGSEPGKVKEPVAVAVGPGDSLWVADAGNNRIEQWNSSLVFVRQIGSDGLANGQFKRPTAVEVDARGNIWVGDQNNIRIQQFNETGAFLGKFSVAGVGGAPLSAGSPIGVAVDPKGNIWVADANNHRVQKWITPLVSVGSSLGPLTAAADDRGFGATSLKVKLVGAAGQTETLESVNQPCLEGGCSLKPIFEGVDLSERLPGIYTLIVEATDGAGNSSRTSSRFSLNVGPPQLTLSGALAEGAGQPLTTASGELSINASETDIPSSGVRKINVALDHQPVASRTFNCAAGCQEVASTFRYSARRDGADRSIEAAPTVSEAPPQHLTGISCPNASDCTAVGYYKDTVNGGYIFESPLVEHWDGTAWQVVTSPKPPPPAVFSRLEDVSCTSAMSCIAVGYSQTFTGFVTLVMRWNGTAWSVVPSPNATGFARNYLYGVSCSSSIDCWAVGKSAYTAEEEAAGKTQRLLLMRWNGSSWTITNLENAAWNQLKSVSCVSATFCMAVSGGTERWAARWNGTTWSSVNTANMVGSPTMTLSGISCTAATACTAVGSYTLNGRTAPLVQRWNGSGFSVQKATDPTGVVEEATSGVLDAVSCWGPEACTAVGTHSTPSETQPLIEGWDGTDWALQPAAVPSGITTSTLDAIACAGAFNCLSVGTKGASDVLIEREVPDQGDKTLTVEAIDKYGNAATKSIEIDVPERTADTPSCDQEATSVAAKGVVSASEASSALQGSMPRAVAPSEATTHEATDEVIDPSYSAPNPNLESLGTPTEGETQVTPDGGFTLEGIACVSPAQITGSATEAKVINSDAAIFANTAPETDTLLRPNAAGMTMVQSLRGVNAPRTISWNVTLNPDENLVELPSGAVAITRDGTEATGNTPEVAEPEGMRSPLVLNDAELQLETSRYQLVEAQSETTEEVIAVIPQPWVILSQGGIIPLKVEVQQDVAIPTEYTMTYEYPPFQLNFTPKAVVTEIEEAGATASASASYNCIESPCGQFVVSEAVQYAKKWGKPEKNSRYPNFGSENCTNFLSQIMAHGGMAYMRFGEEPSSYKDGAWWVLKTGPSDEIRYLYSTSWVRADELPRHLWQYGLVDIDRSDQPAGWQTGNMMALDWYSDGKGNFNHVQFVSGTRTPPGSAREPLIANSSEPADANYSEKPWIVVKARIEAGNPAGWNRVPLVPKHRYAIWYQKGAKKHDPDNLYNAGGVFQG